jgi:hypothetical protein
LHGAGGLAGFVCVLFLFIFVYFLFFIFYFFYFFYFYFFIFHLHGKQLHKHPRYAILVPTPTEARDNKDKSSPSRNLLRQTVCAGQTASQSCCEKLKRVEQFRQLVSVCIRYGAASLRSDSMGIGILATNSRSFYSSTALSIEITTLAHQAPSCHVVGRTAAGEGAGNKL